MSSLWTFLICKNVRTNITISNITTKPPPIPTVIAITIANGNAIISKVIKTNKSNWNIFELNSRDGTLMSKSFEYTSPQSVSALRVTLFIIL